MYLFDLATYFKAKGEDWEEKILHINQEFDDPLPEKRIASTIISSQRKKTYSYRCKEEPMCSNCHKDFCLKRLYGYGGDQVSKLSFENLVQVKGDEPIYKWTVNGIVMTFRSEAELKNQAIFSDYCMRELHIVPNPLEKKKWYKILEEAFREITVEEIDPEDDISPGAMLISYIEEFLLNRAPATSKDQVRSMARVYREEEKQEFVFKKESLIKFLTFNKNFRYFSIVEIQDRLKRIGAKPRKFYCGNKTTIRVWTIPYSFVKEKMTAIADQVVDFSEYKEREDF